MTGDLMAKRAGCLSVALLMLASVVPAGAEDRPFPHVPTTISPEAQQFLRNVTPPRDGNPQSLADWQRLRREVNGGMRPAAEALLRKSGARTQSSELGGVKVLTVTAGRATNASGSVILYLHGGAFTLEDPFVTLPLSIPVAEQTGLKVIAVDYRLAPEHPYPAALDDCLAVYRDLLKTHRPGQIGVYGDSAGGGLALSLVLRAHAEKLPMPAVLALISPWADLTNTGDTYATLKGISPVLDYEKNLRASATAYAGKRDLKDPLISPVYADYPAHFPPTLIQIGTRDMFLSNCARLQRKLKTASANTVELSLWEGMWHNFQAYSDIPEAGQALTELSRFLAQPLIPPPTSPR